jgi:uncharacterized OB-fold protein
MAESKKRKLPQCFGCNNCGYRSSSYKAICPACGGTEMEVLEAAGRGKIEDFVSVLYPPENLKDLGQYVSVLVKLDNGCRIFGIILEDSDNIAIGTSVVVSSFNVGNKELFFKLA